VRKKQKPESCRTLQVHAPKPVSKHENLNPCQEAISRHNRKKFSSIIHHGTFFSFLLSFFGGWKGRSTWVFIHLLSIFVAFCFEKKEKKRNCKKKRGESGARRYLVGSSLGSQGSGLTGTGSLPKLSTMLAIYNKGWERGFSPFCQ